MCLLITRRYSAELHQRLKKKKMGLDLYITKTAKRPDVQEFNRNIEASKLKD